MIRIPTMSVAVRICSICGKSGKMFYKLVDGGYACPQCIDTWKLTLKNKGENIG
jgi:hypothetical protein